MLTAIHTLICFVAIGTGIVAIWGLFRPEPPEPWTSGFLIAAVLATADLWRSCSPSSGRRRPS